MKAIGINGDVGVGKDTFFEFLPGKPMRFAFADAVKREVSDWLGATTLADALWFLSKHRCDYETLIAIVEQTWQIKLDSADCILLHRATTFQSKVACLAIANLHDAKRNLWVGRAPKALKSMHDRKRKEAFRALMRWWGTDYRRVQCRDDYWLEQIRIALRDKLKAGHYPVFTDTRFPNEAAFVVKECGGVVIELTRPGTEDTRVHASDKALKDWPFDATIRNEGTLEDLKAEAEMLYLKFIG